MRRAAGSDSYAQMLAVLVVAEWSYLDWAAPHADKGRGPALLVRRMDRAA